MHSIQPLLAFTILSTFAVQRELEELLAYCPTQQWQQSRSRVLCVRAKCPQYPEGAGSNLSTPAPGGEGGKVSAEVEFCAEDGYIVRCGRGQSAGCQPCAGPR
eukprot:1157269-Pelagomonas_calceolata.AAC.2